MDAIVPAGEDPEPEINASAEDDEPNIFGWKKSYGKVDTAAAAAAMGDENQDAENQTTEDDKDDESQVRSWSFSLPRTHSSSRALSWGGRTQVRGPYRGGFNKF